MTDFIIRAVHADDHDAWRDLFHGYAEFYGITMDDATADTVWHWLLDPTHMLEGLIALNARGEAVGIAHVRACPRPLGGCNVGFLDDLFVAPAERGSGAADALFSALRELAGERGWPAIRWVTQHFNTRGRGFYDRYTNGPTDFIVYQWQTATDADD